MALRQAVALGLQGLRSRGAAAAVPVWQPVMSMSSKPGSQEVILPEETTGEVLAPITGFPKGVQDRVVRITEPARKTIQSGRFARGGGWKILWDTQKRWENPLMGWGSSADPMSNLHDLNFDSKEAAVRFAEKNGWKYYVYEQPQNDKAKLLGKKAYGDNFSWDTRTRTNTK
eukprot:m.432108 g.432108  ORF g.432108 m.432108 type:complete len:172 (+) comp17390_c0_seq1:41-556(+)